VTCFKTLQLPVAELAGSILHTRAFVLAANASSEAARGLVKSRVSFAAREFPVGLCPHENKMAAPPQKALHNESRELRKLPHGKTFHLSPLATTA